MQILDIYRTKNKNNLHYGRTFEEKMSDIKVITAPDILHSTELSFLLIHPSKIVKDQFQDLIDRKSVV